MAIEQEVIEQIIGAIKQDPKAKNHTHSAEVARVDDEGTVWVYVAGSDRETPTASTSAEVKQGDAVMVEWRNDRLYIAGNYSDPSAGAARVQAVEDAASAAGQAASRALTAAASAEESAETAATAAAAAVEDAAAAGRAAAAAGTAAEEADRKATAAGQAASSAQTSADNAQASANNASEYAARALGNLSTVQSVTETLNWITAHGTMTKTDDYVPSADTEVVEGKKYYTRSGSGTAQDPYVYTLVSDPTGDPSASGYYEGALDPTHVYFVQDSNGDYTVGGVKYAVVTEPSIDDIADYYVLSIDESLNNYVATHLSVTSEGLWILPATRGYKILIATGAGTTYTTAGTYIIDASGDAVAFFGTDVNIGTSGNANLHINAFGVYGLNEQGVPVFSVAMDGATDTTTVQFAQKYSFRIRGNTGSKQTISTFTLDNLPETGTQFSIQAECPENSGNAARFTFTRGTTETKSKSFRISTFVQLGVYITYNAADDTFSGYAQYYDVIPSGAQTLWIGYLQYEKQIPSPAFSLGTRKGFGGIFSVCLGSNNEASGNYSVAIGNDCEATEQCAHANGNGAAAVSQDQTAIGKYNEKDANNKYAFIVGNGTADDARSNAHAFTWDGNMEMAIDTSATSGTTDGDLYAAITALGWESEVID